MDKQIAIDTKTTMYFINKEIFKTIDNRHFRGIHHAIPPNSYTPQPFKNVNFVKPKMLNVL